MTTIAVRTVALAVVATALLASSQSAHAGLIRYDFTGAVDTVFGSGIPGAMVSPGDTFSGTIAFDDAAVDFSANSSVGRYRYGDIPNDFQATFNLGALQFVTTETSPDDSAQIQVRDGLGTAPIHDGLVFDVGEGNMSDPSIAFGGLSLALLSTDLSLLSDVSLSSREFDLGDFDLENSVRFQAYTPTAGVDLYGHLTSFTLADVSPVPEPSSLALLLSGGLIGTVRYRRRFISRGAADC